jgi:hypothetical protein
MSTFDSGGHAVSDVLRAALQQRNVATLGVLRNFEFEELSWITECVPEGVSEREKVSATQELSELWRTSDRHALLEIRAAVRDAATATTSTVARTASTENAIREDVKRRKLDKTLGRNVLTLRNRDATATTQTLGDKDNSKVSTINKGAEDSCRYLWKLWMSMGRDSSVWSPLLEKCRTTGQINGKEIGKVGTGACN